MKEQLQNDRFLRALRKEPVDRTPVWMMRQAGRYLPEYRATRSKAGDFLALCKNAELACEVTLQPLERFPLDAAILFSDILTIPDALGLGLYFETGEGPKFERPCQDRQSIENLPEIKIEDELDYVMNAVTVIKRELAGRVPLIGFSGSPWTLATYMVEGGSSKDFRTLKAMMYREPQVLHLLLERLADAVSDYLIGQIKAGVNAVQIFDTWGGTLGPVTYPEFSLQYMTKIVKNIKAFTSDVPVIVFTKGAGLWLESLASSGADCVGLDWAIDIADARRRIGDKVALQGNMDPSVLYASPARIREEVARILEGFGSGSGHVFNLGHGIALDVDPEHAKVFIEAVHELSKPYHA